MSKQTKFPKTNILGLDIDLIDTDTAVKALVEFGQYSKSAGYLVRPHVEFIESALKQPSIMKLLNDAQFCLADGVALQWAAYHLNSPGKSMWHLLRSLSAIPRNSRKLKGIISQRVAGIAFTLRLLEECNSQGARIFLVGLPQKKTIDQTASFLKQKFHGLKIVGSLPAKRDKQLVTVPPSLEKQLLGKLTAARPDIVLIGLGFPRQEMLMARLSKALDHGLFIGEGGTFDYREFGGHIRRAPPSVQRAGLEWLWRLARQPKRINRQLAIPRFIGRVHKYKRTK